MVRNQPDFHFHKHFLILEPRVCLQLLGVWCRGELEQLRGEDEHRRVWACRRTDRATVWALPLTTCGKPFALGLNSLLYKIRITIASTRGYSANS